MIAPDSLIGNAWEHLGILATGFFAGGAVMGMIRDTVSYAISTFPEPDTKLGKWRLGVLKRIFGDINALIDKKNQDNRTNAATSGQ